MLVGQRLQQVARSAVAGAQIIVGSHLIDSNPRVAVSSSGIYDGRAKTILGSDPICCGREITSGGRLDLR